MERIKIHTMEELALVSEQKLSKSRGIGAYIIGECKKALRQYEYPSLLNNELPGEETGEAKN